MKRIAWWCIRIVCGAVTVAGVLIAVFCLATLVALVSGSVQADMETPPAGVAAGGLVVGLVVMIAGFRAPAWFGVDRLL